MSKRRGGACSVTCLCMCHDTGGVHYGMHGEHPRCPTKDGLPLVEVEWFWPDTNP